MDGNQLFQYKALAGGDRQMASAEDGFAEKRHGQIPFS